MKAPSTAGKITYLKEMNWNQNDLVFGKNGIAALTFCDVPMQWQGECPMNMKLMVVLVMLGCRAAAGAATSDPLDK